MSVYVDDMECRYGRMVMCHMAADSTAELLAMADRVGVARRWLQCPGTWKEHFDVCLSKREAAVAAGAVQLTAGDLFRRVLAPRRGRKPALPGSKAAQNTPPARITQPRRGVLGLPRVNLAGNLANEPITQPRRRPETGQGGG